MTLKTESMKEFGIGTWFMYLAYIAYTTTPFSWIDGLSGWIQFVVGVSVYTFGAMFVVVCLVCGGYFTLHAMSDIVEVS